VNAVYSLGESIWLNGSSIVCVGDVRLGLFAIAEVVVEGEVGLVLIREVAVVLLLFWGIRGVVVAREDEKLFCFIGVVMLDRVVEAGRRRSGSAPGRCFDKRSMQLQSFVSPTRFEATGYLLPTFTPRFGFNLSH